SRLGNSYVTIMLSLRVKDATAGFRVYSAELLRSLDLNQVQARGYAFQVDMTRRARRYGASIIELPICFVERQHGSSKMSGSIVAEAIWLVTKWGVTKRWNRAKTWLFRRQAGPLGH
ncbi:MAG: dolichol-phosphate mannosyltransferase, partial [Micrococcales bacterium]|nr:dolichol-phosphate mannosyltransferase [Micrococcales bacterium]